MTEPLPKAPKRRAPPQKGLKPPDGKADVRLNIAVLRGELEKLQKRIEQEELKLLLTPE